MIRLTLSFSMILGFFMALGLQGLRAETIDPFEDINDVAQRFEGENLSSHLVVKFATDKDILFVLKGMFISRPALIKSEHWKILDLWFEDSTNLSLDTLVENHESPNTLSRALEKEFGKQRMKQPNEVNSALEQIKAFFRQISALEVVRKARTQGARREMYTILSKSAFVIKKSLLGARDLLLGKAKSDPDLKRFLGDTNLTQPELNSILAHTQTRTIQPLVQDLVELFEAELHDTEALIQSLETFQDKIENGLRKLKK
jgi:hypothetical protein